MGRNILPLFILLGAPPHFYIEETADKGNWSEEIVSHENVTQKSEQYGVDAVATKPSAQVIYWPINIVL